MRTNQGRRRWVGFPIWPRNTYNLKHVAQPSAIAGPRAPLREVWLLGDHGARFEVVRWPSRVAGPVERQPVEGIHESAQLPPPRQCPGSVRAESNRLPRVHTHRDARAEEPPQPHSYDVRAWVNLGAEGFA